MPAKIASSPLALLTAKKLRLRAIQILIGWRPLPTPLFTDRMWRHSRQWMRCWSPAPISSLSVRWHCCAARISTHNLVGISPSEPTKAVIAKLRRPIMSPLKKIKAARSSFVTMTKWGTTNHKFVLIVLSAWLAVCSLGLSCVAQTSATGAISGVVTDSSGALVVGAKITATNLATGATTTASSSSAGKYLFPLLPPGSYKVDASKEGFKVLSFPSISVNVTETEALNIRLQVGDVNETVEVDTSAEQLQTETSTLGNVTTHQMVENLPLVTRNYTQIIGLSPGIASDVTNAAGFGRGGGSNGEEAFVANGGPSNDNNFQMNGVPINDLQGSGSFSGGVAVPNPDTIEEFKVQTGQYDASFGRNAGANVNVLTKGGTNAFHGTLFEYLRNEALNANDYFRKLAGQPRQILRQNQFG